MALINCKECGKELSDTAEFCPHCGYKEHHEEHPVDTEETQQQNTVEPPVQPEKQQNDQNISNNQTQSEIQQTIQNNESQMQVQVESTNRQVELKNFMKNKPTTVSIIIVVVALVIGIVIATSIFNNAQESKKPIRVDISMTEWYGYVDYILEEFDLDFYLVTAGANCYTGVKKSEFHTEKYGILHTEFSYCKSNKRQVFRIYNDENDQPLRDPKPGELPTFDRYGKKTSSSRNSL